ncbi:MAG: tartrate dehydrogenase [Planctomycetes bacterium]|nr:tartrate dehydrogenase [Planctomycetota bacterium]
MKTFSIAVLAGDGIGPEVIDQAIPAAERAAPLDDARFQWTPYPWNSDHYRRHGRMAAPDFLEQLRPHDAILLGAIGHPDLPDHVTLNGLLLPIRRGFDQCVCIRPAYLYAGVLSPLVHPSQRGYPRSTPLGGEGSPAAALGGWREGEIDILVFRENVEGEYAQIGGRLYNGSDHEVAVQTALFTRRGCRRIMRPAFEAARKRRRKVTSITKSNAQGYGMVLWDETFREVARDYPDVQTESLLIDRACMDFVRRPQDFDVVVASNLFGDILTDLAAILVGSMGLAPSANINPERTAPSMFEPVHGSAPDIAGRGIANPLAAILSAAMMMDHLELPKGAAAVRRAVADVLRSGAPRTPDLGGKATTAEVAGAVCELLDS